MVRVIPFGPPTFVILMTVTMPSLAAPKQDAFAKSVSIVESPTLVIRPVDGAFAITSVPPPRPEAEPATVLLGRSVAIDAARFSPKSRKSEQPQ